MINILNSHSGASEETTPLISSNPEIASDLNQVAEKPSLDPVDWEAYRQLAHEALDEAINYVQKVRDRPVWQPVPMGVKRNLASSLPTEQQSLNEVFTEFKENILPYASGNVHPRFFGWVHGSGQPGNIVADLLSSAMNCNCGARDHIGLYVEREVTAWVKALFHFPEEAAGLMVTGTSMANLIAIGVARNALDKNVRRDGLAALTKPITAYASSEVHSSLGKAMEILGLGHAHLRKIPVNPDFTMDIHALRSQISEDREAGYQPFCVIGCAGTVNTGAIDDLEGLATLCQAEGIWFHVDGAFGALCMMSDRLAERVKGIERADSLAFDFHKWAHVQYDSGFVLVRDGNLYRQSYSTHPDYLHQVGRGLAAGGDWPCDFGPELSRGFRALKVWFALKEHGTVRLGELINQNCDQAAYLTQRIASEQELELLAPATLNIVCFRYLKDGLDAVALDRFNQELVADIQESGIAVPSYTRVHGKVAIRVNITNHRTQFSDMDVMVDAVLLAGRARQ